MLSWFKQAASVPRSAPPNESVFAVRFGAMCAGETIAEQIDKFERETRQSCKSNIAIRKAIDDFIVGYALGVAVRTAELNGGSGVLSMPVIEEVGTRLADALPGLNLTNAVKTQNDRYKCGFFIGSVEAQRTGKYEALEYALQLTSHHQLAPSVYFQQAMTNALGLSADEYELAGSAARRIAREAGNPNI